MGILTELIVFVIKLFSVSPQVCVNDTSCRKECSLFVVRQNYRGQVQVGLCRELRIKEHNCEVGLLLSAVKLVLSGSLLASQFLHPRQSL